MFLEWRNRVPSEYPKQTRRLLRRDSRMPHAHFGPLLTSHRMHRMTTTKPYAGPHMDPRMGPRKGITYGMTGWACALTQFLGHRDLACVSRVSRVDQASTDTLWQHCGTKSCGGVRSIDVLREPHMHPVQYGYACAVARQIVLEQISHCMTSSSHLQSLQSLCVGVESTPWNWCHAEATLVDPVNWNGIWKIKRCHNGFSAFHASFLTELENELAVAGCANVTYPRILNECFADVLLRLLVVYGDRLYFLTGSVPFALMLIHVCKELDPMAHITFQLRSQWRESFTHGLTQEPLFQAYLTSIHFQVL